jgi:hypothetical protein
MVQLRFSTARIAVAAGFLLALGTAQTGFATLLVYCPMDETTNPSVGLTVANTSGIAANGVMLSDNLGSGAIVGAPSVNAGLYGTAYDFASQATEKNYVDLNNGTTNLFTRDAALTYTMWLKPTTTQLDSTNTVIGTPGNGFEFKIVSSGSNWALNLVCTNAPTSTLTSSIATIPSDAWTHVAITKDINGSGGTNLANVNFYINGVLQESGTIGRSSGTPSSGVVRRLFFAADGVVANYYQGGMDEVHVYNEVLDASAIANLAVVPEPSAGMLLACGTIGLGCASFRRRISG